MPSAAFFRRLGLFLAPDFLDSDLVATLCDEMRSAPSERATILGSDGIDHLDEAVRRVHSTMLRRDIRAVVRARFVALIPQLEEHFHTSLAGCERPLYFLYREGDYFRPHTDRGSTASHHDVRNRRVSAVVFLNRESPQPESGTYGCGRLTIYGLLDGPSWSQCGLPVSASSGLLVAFPSDRLHEVTPVSHGERLTVVTWYFGPPGDPDRAAGLR
jgi:SM-20-related protein